MINLAALIWSSIQNSFGAEQCYVSNYKKAEASWLTEKGTFV